MRRAWCDRCRDGADKGDVLLKCSACPRRFHRECIEVALGKDSTFKCRACEEEGSSDAEEQERAKAVKASIARVRAEHTRIRARSSAFYRSERKRLAPFVPKERLKGLMEVKQGSAAGPCEVPRIGPSESYIQAELRDYQVEGVNWILTQYELGVGGIVADEMGLGKTIQTLSFLATLKHKGLPGPHLVIAPLAVIQNWENEIKRFVPSLSVIKVHGSAAERDRLMSMPEVLGGEVLPLALTAINACVLVRDHARHTSNLTRVHVQYDIYLTTYEMVITMEAFFTENFLFHTITIDEGHRIKNDAAKLVSSLVRAFVA